MPGRAGCAQRLQLLMILGVLWQAMAAMGVSPWQQMEANDVIPHVGRMTCPSLFLSGSRLVVWCHLMSRNLLREYVRALLVEVDG